LAGALVAGFLSVPLLGVGGTFAAIAALAAALGAASAIASGAPRRKATVVAALALVAVAALAALRFQPERLHAGDRIVSRVDGPSASVAVIEDEHGTRRLVANDRYTLGDTASRVVERREALLPFVLRPRPARTVVIGLATGITADAACEAALVSSGTVVVAELLPEVVRLAPAFEPFLGRAPRARVVVADGRRYLARDEALADLVVSDIFAPWQPGTAYLYTLEHFSSVRAHLGPGGAFALWLPLFQLSPSSLVLILRTFETAFPGSRLYAGSLEGERPIVLAFSRGADPGAGVERRRLALAGVLADDPVLSIDGGEAALDLGPLEVVVPAVASAFSVRDDRVQRDDRPWVEFEAARAYARGLALTGARFEKLVLAADLACGPGESAGWHAVRASWASAGSARGHLKSALSGNGSVRGREAALPLVHAVARTRSAALSAAGDPLAGGELAALAALASSGNERTKAALAATAAFRKAGALARAEAVLREIAPGDALLPPDEAALALEGAQLALARRDADRALAWLFRVPEGDAFVPGLVLVAVAQDSRSERALARKALVEAYRRDAKTAERELQRLGVLAWGRALVGER
ncbi:hypothetical protein HY251_20060, partial [bacterium]|nr:hypothetical protein [bacterium]